METQLVRLFGDTQLTLYNRIVKADSANRLRDQLWHCYLLENEQNEKESSPSKTINSKKTLVPQHDKRAWVHKLHASIIHNLWSSLDWRAAAAFPVGAFHNMETCPVRNSKTENETEIFHNHLSSSEMRNEK